MKAAATFLLLLILALSVPLNAAGKGVPAPAIEAMPHFEHSQPRGVAPFPLVLNSAVRSYVDSYLANSEGLRESYERSAPYFRRIIEVLRRYGLPKDMIYLAFAESRFTKHGAGPWQLTKATARRFGLRINRYVDERRDPIKSTRAAAEYLAQLHDAMGDWRLTIAAWNTGEGAINELANSSELDYKQLLASLPQRTRALLNRFMAVAFIAQRAKAYGLQDADYGEIANNYTRMHAPGGSLVRVARELHTTVVRLRRLNPALLTNRVPPGGYDIMVPLNALSANY